MTATRMARGATLAAAVVVWGACAWLLWRTSVPSLHLPVLDERRYFGARELARMRSFSRGEDAIWLVETLARIAALLVLVRRGPRGWAAVPVVLATLWLVGLPFALADLWWQHRWGVLPFVLGSWLGRQWSTWPQAVGALVGIALTIWLARRLRRWYLVAAPAIVVVAALYAFVSGWIDASGTRPLRVVDGVPVRVESVSSRTHQLNAFTDGFGPSTHIVVWNTMLRLPRDEVNVVIAHELGHVRSHHVLKAIGWLALVVLPVLWLLDRLTRRRGGVGDPANVPYLALVLVLLGLATAPVRNAVSRRYEQEADWRALNATHDPRAAVKLFEAFGRTSLEDPDPGVLDYLWLEDHPTLMQRIALASARSSRGGPGSP